MQPTDITTEILIGIRDEIRSTNARLDQTNARLDDMRGELRDEIRTTNSRLDEMRAELSKRIVDSEIRTATAISDLAGTVREMTGVLRTQAELRPRVEKCERDIDDLRRRMSHG
jgi:hypothetical protein